MPLIIDGEIAQANSRTIGIWLAMLTLRLMENWRSVVDDNDMALILLAVVAISSEQYVRGERLEVELRDLRKIIPLEMLKPCNVSSIAAATGLNRESTRRKVNELIERGLLERTKKGVIRFPVGFVQKGGTVELVRTQFDSIARLANDMIRDRVFQVVDSG